MPEELADELLDSFEEAKRRFFRNDLRPSAVEGGRFSEAVFRVLQWATNGKYTPLGRSLPKVDQLLATFANAIGHSDSLRLHIPRTLRLIYDIRNKRDAAHLSDGIDPNLQDATLVVRNMDWVMAECIRLYHHVTPDEAQHLIEDLVTKEVPVIQEFNGYPRILRDLSAGDHCLVLLYRCGAEGASFTTLSDWIKPEMRRNIRRTVQTLSRKHLAHIDGDHVYITIPGERAVETRGLVEPAAIR